MSRIVISVENLSKNYRLGQIGTGTLTNDIKVWWAKKRGKSNPLLKIGQTDYGNIDGETLWALKNVSFDVEQGEVLGVIGRNGAGKSTLLKILSRVTAPSEGCIKVKGRIASLLEVGTGFHPDLTGRENIYLNGAILGMTKPEINRKFDEIVNFAEIEKFVDTPVKRFSSGMYVRLAFAVAAHLESEILLVDEVLAVGDAEFQKKCLGKMGDVALKEGRTVLFVSHNMAAITVLCNQCLMINHGNLQAMGKTSTIISSYMSKNEFLVPEHENDSRNDIFNVEISPKTITANSQITISANLHVKQNIDDYKIFLIIQDDNSNILVHSSRTSKNLKGQLSKGTHKLNIEFPALWLRPGNYNMQIKFISLAGKGDRILSPSYTFEIKYDIDYENSLGILIPDANWFIE